MMDFELRLEKPNTSRAWISALVMGISYFLGGLIPMIPYFAIHNLNHALFVSIGITVLMLLSFGYYKAIFTGTCRKSAVGSALQTLFVGILAAGSSYGIVKSINAINPTQSSP
jgi:predicted membrane protein (TIGR00267 family)